MKFRRSNKRKVSAALDMTPLIDVVFQLVIFFMLSSTFVVQTSIPIQISEAEGTATYEHKDVSVTLTYDPDGPGGRGSIWVADQQLGGMSELSQLLVAARAESPDVMVLIRPDARIETAQLVEVLGIATSVGIKNLGIAAQPPVEGE
jgi:biopolymer transport protein ExbD